MEEAGFLFTDFYFNSLPHAEVDGVQQAINADTVAFQLTTSRRGRQGLISEPCKSVYFNSLPHAEVDCSEYGSGRPENISTHYLTQR